MVKNKNKNLALIFVAIVILALIATNIFTKNGGDSYINITELPEEFITEYLDSVSAIEPDQKENLILVSSIDDLSETYGATKVIEAPNHQYFLQYDSPKAAEEARISLKQSGVNVQKNYKYRPVADYNSWGVSAIGIDYAIDQIAGISQNEIVAAIIDSGCDLDLLNRYYPNKLAGSFNAVNSSASVTDLNGHGTHVAGTIAESTPANVKVFPVQATSGSEGEMYTSDIITGINYIVYYHKANVINMSLGSILPGGEEDIAFYRAIEAAKQQDIISVAAAGNEATDLPSVPASFDNTISISAVDSRLQFASFSNYGDTISFAAPGVFIKSIMGDNVYLASQKQSGDDADHGTLSGTSMATPHATAAVAILKSINTSLSFDDTVEVLKSNAVDLGSSGWDQYYGYGLINFKDAEFCTDPSTQNCDDYSIYRVMVPSNISVTNVQLTDRNYYSLTNILSSTISVTGSDGMQQSFALGELDDITITGYDPTATGEQTVSVQYTDQRTTFKVTNPTSYSSGWQTQTLSDGTLNLSGYVDSQQNAYKLYIPNQINGKTVSSISANFSNSSNAPTYREVVLPNSITSVSYGNFTQFSELRTLTSLADELYVGSLGLSDIPKLETINGTIYIDGASTSAFSEDKLLKFITLSDRVTTIPNAAFSGTENLKSILLPDNVTTIGEGAFSRSGLESIALGDKLTTIGEYAFYSTRLGSVHIPKSVTSITSSSFAQNEKLETITIASDNPIYDSRNNANAIIETATNTLITGINNTTIPNSVTTIASHAFFQLYVDKVVIPASVRTIAEEAFYDCFALDAIVFPANHIDIDENALSENTGFWTIFGTTFWVYDNSDTLTYAINHHIPYKLINSAQPDEHQVLGYYTEYVPANEEGRNYRAFEKITPDNFTIVVYYTDESTETISSFTSVAYPNGTDSLRAGKDTEITITFTTETGFHDLKLNAKFDVDKANPIYTVPTGLTADPGQKLSEITLPAGFSWMNSTETIAGAGNVSYNAKYTPSDTANYNVIENIPVTIFVRTPKTLIVPNFSISTIPYNYTVDHIDPYYITITNLAAADYTIVNSVITSSETATITVRLSDAKFESHYFDGGIQEKAFDVTIVTTPITNDYMGAYDGAAHSFTFNMNINSCDILYSTDGEHFNITTKPSYTAIGNYYIDMQISCPNRETITNSAIISIQGFTVSGNLSIKQTAIVLPNNRTSTLTDNFSLNQGLMGTMPELLDSTGTDLGFPYPETLKTGYKYRFDIGSTTYIYDIAILGDNSGDGEIDDTDFDMIRQYLRSGGGLDGAYLTAGDVTNDDTVNSGDLLRYKQHILNIKTIGGDN